MSAPMPPAPGYTPVTGIVPLIPHDLPRGREADRDAVAKMMAQDWVRAGLVVGEIGVGKSAFLNRVLVPHLAASGTIAIVCADRQNPTQGFATAATQASGIGARLDERPLDFLVRLVGSALAGKMIVFVYDDLDLALRGDRDGKLAHEMGDLLSRVCGRPGGKARFLFTAADTRVASLDALERRTGSLFPITSRYTLGRLTGAQAADVLAELLASAPGQRQPDLPAAVVEELADATGGVLPIDVTFASQAIRTLGIDSVAALGRLGGTRELLRRWVETAATATHDRGQAMRLLGELAERAQATANAPVAIEELAARAGVPASWAQQAVRELSLRGVVSSGDGVALTHEALAPRLFAITAPAAEGARRARSLLAAAASRRGRLSFKDARFIRSEGVAPQTAEEQAVLSRTRRFKWILAGAAIAGPLLLLVIGYSAQSSAYHAAIERDRVVIKAGKPSLSALWWMPSSPAFGSTVADTGLTPELLGKDAAAKLGKLSGDLEESRDGRAAYVAATLDLMPVRQRAVLRYALRPDDGAALAELQKIAQSPDEWLAILAALEPVAKGGPAEGALIAQALGETSIVVQSAALAMAARVEARRPGSYAAALAEALGSASSGVRRQAYAAIRGLPRDRLGGLYAMALAGAKDPAARQQALTAVAGQRDIPAPAAAEAAVAILSDAGAGDELHKMGWSLLEKAWTGDPAAAARATAKLLAADGATEAMKREALRLLIERAPAEVHGEIADAVAVAAGAQDNKLRAAALPLQARVAPTAAVKQLVLDPKLPVEIRAAQAEGWGELARAEPQAAAGALETLLADPSTRVRAAAARAYGRLGKMSQDKLGKLVKEGGDVGEGAAFGLVASAEAGGSASAAVGGINQLWKKKGSARRTAARAFARLARTRPGAVVGYLASAAEDKDDEALRPIGVDGLCAALNAGSEKAAGSALRDAAASDFADARARVAACLAARTESDDTSGRIALRLASDPDAATRAAAATALAASVKGSKGKVKDLAEALVKLVGDDDRGVRTAAVGGLAALGTKAPQKEAGAALRAALSRASGEDEKLAIVEAALAVEDDGTCRAALGDASPAVRRRALGCAVALKADVEGALQRAFGDDDASVRREAVRLLGDPKTLVSEADAARLLDAALRDADAVVANEALALLPQLSDPDALAKRITTALASTSERERQRGAQAALGLAMRDAKKAAALLEPALSDGAHDVRAALVPALATAWARTQKPDELAKRLRAAEADAMVRVTAAWALWIQAKGKEPVAGAEAAVAKVAKDGPPFCRLMAELTVSLIKNEADGPAFLATMVP